MPLLLGFAIAAQVGRVWAAETISAGTPIPLLADVPSTLDPHTGEAIVGVELRAEGRWFSERVIVSEIRVGDRFDPVLVRSTLRRLLDTGRFASAQASVHGAEGGVVVRFSLVARRLVGAVEIEGVSRELPELGELLGRIEGRELADSDVDPLLAQVIEVVRNDGVLVDSAKLVIKDGSEPLSVVLRVVLVTRGPRVVQQRRFAVPSASDKDQLRTMLEGYPVAVGDIARQRELERADRSLEQDLRDRGWHRAKVAHRLESLVDGVRVHVAVEPGPHVEVTFEGNRVFDAAQLEEVLADKGNTDRAPRTLADLLVRHYQSYGFLDVDVRPLVEDKDTRRHRVTLRIREGQPVRVVAREYPCLSGERSPAEIGEEIDSFLTELLPGSALVGPIEPAKLDDVIGPVTARGSRPGPFQPTPYATYVAPVYERAMKHVQDLLRSEGYLAATVGPAQLLRRRCSDATGPLDCEPIGPLRRPLTTCSHDELGLPLPEPAPSPLFGCVPDARRHTRCEPNAVLHIPIKMGPRTRLYRLDFDGNEAMSELRLAELLELRLGEPLSLAEVEQARRQLLDAYAEEGFAYADVATKVETSPDKTRGRVGFSIREGQRVRVGEILVRGASRTSERLIRSRFALEPGGVYQKSRVRETEERLATLGVFSSVRVSLEDPYVPAAQKNVWVEVVERRPQYFEGRPGFGTGEGFRLSAEYGHLNLASEAISLTFLTHLGYLPNELILESDVRRKYETELDTVGRRLERRISVLASFPDIGLGPLFRLQVEGIDLRDNARDFSLVKDAGGPTLSFLWSRRTTFQLGASVERNDVRILGSTQKGALLDYVLENPNRANVFRVPEGTSGAFAQRFTATWDRRDVPLGATEGSLVTTTLEHVTSRPMGDDASSPSEETNPFQASDSEFLRWTSRVALYLPLTRRRTSLALSFRFGLNHQLKSGSRTYPDRLFFLGGMDSVRGMLQDSMIPDDVAAQLLDPDASLRVSDVVIRGGNFFVNPRAELRIPLSSSVQTAVFVDAGNLWSRSPTEGDLEHLEGRYQPKYWRLRYATGTGLRINTPVGPLVFDYGLNVERVLDRLWPGRARPRTWEDLGAFHFSIGTF